jgi:hypothetical protein
VARRVRRLGIVETPAVPASNTAPG